ncbi:MAG: CHAT domain-containing protein [Ignavibacteriales bacterium]|nr:CHAT domain-containing protein [Ignavibacteriales bacterium]MCF8316835.1 CHAT domain-containing protein [Ignavibacteriales bacterium]MCF8438411.1 CHAT domain-containing protein [Ignavibacteriales bacterium]
MKGIKFLIITIIFINIFTQAQSLDSLNTLIFENYSKGDYQTASVYAEKAVEKCKQDSGKLSDCYVESLNNLGVLYEALGRFNDIFPLYLEALEVIKQTGGNENQHYVITLNNLAGLYQSVGKYDDALPIYLEALNSSEKKSGKKHPEYSKCLNNLAVLYKEMGRNEDALPLFLEAMEINGKTLGKEHWEYGVNLNNLAHLNQLMGRYKEALQFSNESLSVTEKTLGKSHITYSIRLNNLAVLYRELGRNEEALPLILEALNITENTLGKEHANYGFLLNNLAFIYQAMGLYDEALETFLTALENTEKTLGKDHYEYGNRLNNLAMLYREMGRDEEALSLSLDAFGNTERALGKDHADYGVRLHNLALIYMDLDRYDESQKLFLEALPILTAALGKDHSKYGNILVSLKELYIAMNQDSLAAPLIIEANQNLIKQIKSVFSFSSEKNKREFFASLCKNFDQFQSFMLKTGGKYEDLSGMMYDDLLILKGQILNESKAMLQSVFNNPDSLVSEKYSQWIGLKRRLATQFGKPISSRKFNIDSLQNIANKLESELVMLSKDFQIVREKEAVTWKDIRGTLKDDEIAIEFSRFRYYDRKWTDSVYYVAYVVTPGCENPEMIVLFEENELLKFLRGNSPESLYNTRSLSTVAAKSSSGLNDSLYNLILKPLESVITGKKNIYFSTDGNLHQIAFAALQNTAGILMCEKHNLVQLNSTNQIIVKREQPSKEPALLAGGINFNYDKGLNTDTSGTFNFNPLSNKDKKLRSAGRRISDEWQYLEGSKNEIELINKIYREKNLSATVLSGEAATEEEIKKLDGNSPKILHLATHGFFFEDPEDKRKDGYSDNNTYAFSDDPLLRSGLVLAGANYAWKNGVNPYKKEDGILSSYEISNLNLSNTDLVVLSACETGLGDIEGSEGVYGLQRAFRMAGADYLIMSLWSVPDEETVEFMEIFYKSWLSDKTIREAFTSAQVAMSNKYRTDPDKWAAFVLVE